MSIRKVNGSNGVNGDVEIYSVEGHDVLLSNGLCFTAGHEPFPDEEFTGQDLAICKQIVGRFKNTEEFLVSYFIRQESVDKRLQDILQKYFGSSLRRFYLYMTENTTTSYVVTAYGMVNASDGLTFEVDSSYVKTGVDGEVSLVSEEDHTGYVTELDIAMGEQLITGEFEMSSHHVEPVLKLNDEYRGVTYDQIANYMIDTDESVSKEHLNWIRGGMRGEFVEPTQDLTESSQSSVTH